MNKNIFYIITLIAFFANNASAQMKMGSNPTTINTALNLEVEATNGTKTAIDKATGNVGIGTTTPKTRFHLAGTTSGLNAAFGDAGLTLTGASAPRIYWENTSLTAGSRVISASLGGDGIRFDAMSDDAGTMNKNIMTLTMAGNVGIGALTPTATLDVNGQARVRTLPAGVSGDVIVSADANGNLRKLSIANLTSDFVTKINVSPNSGATSGNIPCSAGYDIINYTAADGNWSANITLPNCGVTGQKIIVKSAATFTATIGKANTTGLGTWSVNTGDVYEFVYMNSKWDLTVSPTKNYTFCTAPNSSSATLVAPATPKTIMTFADACWTGTITMPSGGNVGDTYIINDTATFNVTVSTANTTLSSALLITVGSFVRFVKTNQGWARDL